MLGPHPLLHTRPSSLPRVSPEPGSDILSRAQAKTGFLQGTGAGHQLPKTLEPPQSCLTQSHPGTPGQSWAYSSRARGRVSRPASPHPGGSQAAPLHLLGGPRCSWGCWGLPARPGAPLPTRAARLSAVKQVLHSSAASVTLRGERLSDRPVPSCPRPQRPRAATH